MPVMDGLEATRRIRAMKRPDARTIPIIAMTANAFAEDRQRAFAAGMDMHIAKPLEGSEMVGNAGAVCQILAEIGAEAQKEYDIKESQPKTADFSCIVQFCCPQHTHSGTIRQDGKLTSAVPSQAGGRNAVWRGSSAHGWPRG